MSKFEIETRQAIKPKSKQITKSKSTTFVDHQLVSTHNHHHTWPLLFQEIVTSKLISHLFLSKVPGLHQFVAVIPIIFHSLSFSKLSTLFCSSPSSQLPSASSRGLVVILINTTTSTRIFLKRDGQSVFLRASQVLVISTRTPRSTAS
jgi:hypothetical protein